MTSLNINNKKDGSQRMLDKFGARIGDKGVVFFDSTVELGEGTIDQITNVGKLPFVEKVAVMPDAHVGMGCTIGSVIATQDVLIPAAVGVDIGCGIDAWKLNIKRDQLAEHNLQQILHHWTKAIPHGRTGNGGPDDIGKHDAKREVPVEVFNMQDYVKFATEAGGIHPFVKEHFGSLGTGNHFVELDYDQNDDVWLLIHSGSRGPGARIAAYYVKQAKDLMNKFYIDLPDPDLAFLPSGTPQYNGYLSACMWAQKYAFLNRVEMGRLALNSIKTVMGFDREYPLVSDKEAHTPHNFVRLEHHFGKNMWITRKGASSAREDELVCIPGSMGTNSYICRGTGNFLSMHSSSHGAGRAMSRTAALKSISVEDHAKALGDVITNNFDGTIDESPKSYKDLDAVMASQTALVNVENKLTPILNMKG